MWSAYRRSRVVTSARVFGNGGPNPPRYNIGMAAIRSVKPKPRPAITMAAIQRYARQIAEHFKPEKIILFGSFAYGEPHADSDVDRLRTPVRLDGLHFTHALSAT